MQVYKQAFSDEAIAITELIALGSRQAELKAGVARFESGCRHPENTLAAHEQDEISVILSGSFVLHGETGDIQCEAGDVIHIPAGEAHASTAVGDSSVFYVLYG